MRPICVIALCFVVASCDYRCDSVAGTVIEVTNFDAPPDQWKFKPISGAEIYVYWEGYKPLYSHGGRGYCLASTWTRSNIDGGFFVTGLKVPRAVDGIEHITAVSLAYVPGFVMLRPDERSKHPMFARGSQEDLRIHVFRRSKGLTDQDIRDQVFYSASFCPSEEFSDG